MRCTQGCRRTVLKHAPYRFSCVAPTFPVCPSISRCWNHRTIDILLTRLPLRLQYHLIYVRSAILRYFLPVLCTRHWKIGQLVQVIVLQSWSAGCVGQETGYWVSCVCPYVTRTAFAAPGPFSRFNKLKCNKERKLDCYLFDKMHVSTAMQPD